MTSAALVQLISSIWPCQNRLLRKGLVSGWVGNDVKVSSCNGLCIGDNLMQGSQELINNTAELASDEDGLEN